MELDLRQEKANVSEDTKFSFILQIKANLSIQFGPGQNFVGLHG